MVRRSIATTLRPLRSIREITSPMRLRRTASGLTKIRVRSGTYLSLHFFTQTCISRTARVARVFVRRCGPGPSGRHAAALRTPKSLPTGGGPAVRGLDLTGQPDAGEPQRREDHAQDVHRGHDDADRDHQQLQRGARVQRPAHPRPSHAPRQADRQHRDRAADGARGAGAHVTKRDRGHDRQRDNDGLHDQDGAAQPPHESSPAVNECLAGVPGSGGAASGGPPGTSSRRASPAVTTEPVMSTAADPGRSSSPSDSSARPTAASIASSSRSRTSTRSSPNISRATSASEATGIDRGEEFAVTTMSLSTGSSSPSTPATSLSSLTATTPISRAKLNDSVSAAMVAAIPAGLCPASTITVGLRRTTSSLPGELTLANPARTRSGSSAAELSPGPRVIGPSDSETPAYASTAASAHAAFPAWCSPNSGR